LTRGKEEKKENGRKEEKGLTRPPAQRPSSLKLRSQHKHQNISNESNDKELPNKKQEEHTNELPSNNWMKEKGVEESHVSLPQQGWTSWQEMAEKKCPTRNLIVFN